ncbi:MAG: helix-turn-helix transcriptional regulator [Phascolarctobacterium sp.]|nr:helix-turn-helix transcriptional regulator [Phascolarctobacterium sp.]
MAISIFFSEKFSVLRKSHNLGVRDIALILNIKSPVNISFWEKGSHIPSLDVFGDIVTLFAVSPAWLLGYTDEPYNEKVISTIEDELFSETVENNGVKIPLLRKVSWMPEEYWDIKLRSKTYSLPVRANIIFLLHNYIANQRARLIHYFAEESNPVLSKRINRSYYLESFSDIAVYEKKQQQQNLYTTSLHNLLAAKESAKPIFDIQAQKTTEE